MRRSTEVLSADAIQSLKAQVKGEVIIKGEASEGAYRAAIHRWNEGYIEEAGIIVFCQSEEDVSVCVRYVQKWELDLAVTCGRHSYSGGSATKGGLVIDLAKMNKFVIDKASMKVTAQGGCKAEDLEKPADAQGLSLVFGAANDTGIGGITLGGGSGYLTGQYGLVADNLLSARVVLADGSAVSSSTEENPDLFWALRGCGPNFGVVTEFTYRAHNQGPVFHGMIMFTLDKLFQFLNLANLLHERVTSSAGKLCIFLGFSSPPNMGGICPVCLIFYDGPEAEARSLAAPLFDLGPAMENAAMKRYPEITEFSPQMKGPPTHQHYATKSIFVGSPLDVEATKALVDDFAAFLQKYGANVAPSKLVIELRSYAVSSIVPTTATAFAARQEGIFIVAESQSDNGALDSVLRDELRDMIQRHKERLEKKNGHAKGQGRMLSNANISARDEKLADIFGENLGRLRDLKKRYDPNLIFDKWYPIKPE